MCLQEKSNFCHLEDGEDLPHQHIKLSDHLGVELRSTFIQTRKVNGEQLQSKVQKTVGPWKAGRFMPITLRPFSANTYALSKVWFKCCSVNLRAQDINFINSQVKGWLYQDQFEKPEERIIFRPIKMGGLGLHNVRIKGLASLIRTFLETAVNPSFLHSMYHTILFRVYVLEDDSVSSPPPMPPYYSATMFNSIQWVKRNTP